MVMVIKEQLTSLSFHVNQPSHSRNKAISNFDLEIWMSRSWVWSKFNPISNWFAFVLIHVNQITNPEILLFWNLTLKNPRSRSWVRSKIKVHKIYTASNRCTSFSFHIKRTNRRDVQLEYFLKSPPTLPPHTHTYTQKSLQQNFSKI